MKDTYFSLKMFFLLALAFLAGMNAVDKNWLFCGLDTLGAFFISMRLAKNYDEAFDK